MKIKSFTLSKHILKHGEKVWSNFSSCKEKRKLNIIKEKSSWFEHILLHDGFAKGLGISSENLERLLLKIEYIDDSNFN